MQWVSCASSRLTVWLHGLKVRDLSSTPVSRAILETSCSGIRLQTWRKRLNRQRVGLIVFLFFIPAVWQVQNVKPTLFFIFCGMTVKHLLNEWIHELAGPDDRFCCLGNEHNLLPHQFIHVWNKRTGLQPDR